MDDYVDVAERLVEFRDKHPDGSLEQVDLQFIDFAGQSWVVYTAAAYRTPDDERPGHGTAWEPVPGRTPFTKDSELQNAETSAWGRAIVAVLAADTKRGVASAQEVRARSDDTAETAEQLKARIRNKVKQLELTDAMVGYLADKYQTNTLDSLDQGQLLEIAADLHSTSRVKTIEGYGEAAA